MGLTPSPTYAPTIPFLAFFLFQVMFAIITPALITGAFADRVSFKAYLIFLVLWSLLVYIPFVHWVWGGGFLAKMGVVDFAGGIVVHLSAGMAALGLGLRRRQTRLAPGEKVRAAQHPLRGARHRPALVRLVRLQRRQRAGRQRRRGRRLREHQHRRAAVAMVAWLAPGLVAGAASRA